MREGRSLTFYLLATFFSLYVLFLYGPMIVIFILSFQGPTGGLTFPMNGVSLHWFRRLWEGGGIVDIGGAFRRSLALGLVAQVVDGPLVLGLEDLHGVAELLHGTEQAAQEVSVAIIPVRADGMGQIGDAVFRGHA